MTSFERAHPRICLAFETAALLFLIAVALYL